MRHSPLTLINNHWSYLLIKQLMALCVFFSPDSLSAPQAWTSSPPLSFARELLQENERRLIELQEQRAAHSDGVHTELNLFLAQELEEHLLRQEFLQRLAVRLVGFPQTFPVQSFLIQQLEEMAQVELHSPGRDPRLWRFLTYLSAGLKTLPVQQKNFFGFIEQYMKESSVSSPIPPHRFLNSRHYSNERQSTKAQGIDRADLGLLLEAELRVKVKSP